MIWVGAKPKSWFSKICFNLARSSGITFTKPRLSLLAVSVRNNPLLICKSQKVRFGLEKIPGFSASRVLSILFTTSRGVKI